MIAVVTGGVKNLGLAFTEYLLANNYDVYALYHTSNAAAEDLLASHPQVKVIKLDICDEEAVKNFFQGLPNIDILVNNAATAQDDEYQNKSKDAFMRTLETNVGGTFVMTKYASLKMNAGGLIINISSNNALDNYNPLSMDYDVSKAGVNMLTKDFSLALQEKKIKIVAICPGWINTEPIRLMNPEYVKQEMLKSGQEVLLEPKLLVEYIFWHLDSYETGSIIEIKEV